MEWIIAGIVLFLLIALLWRRKKREDEAITSAFVGMLDAVAAAQKDARRATKEEEKGR